MEGMWDEGTVVVENVERAEHTQPSSYTENYRQLRSTKARRNSLPQGKAPSKVSKAKRSAPKTYSNIRQAE